MSVPPASSAVSSVVCADRKAEDLTAVGFEQDVLHREAGRSQRRRHQQAPCAAVARERLQGGKECAPRALRRGQGRVARLLLPQRDDVQRHRDEGRALDDLDQPRVAEVGQELAEHQRADQHADEEHHVEQRDDAGPRLHGRDVSRERQPGGLRRVQPGADQQERQGGTRLARPGRPGIAPVRQEQQRERHDRQPAELHQRAEPDVGHAPPTEEGAVLVGAEADQRPQRREQERQRDHRRDEPRRHAELDDHHPVQRAGEQHDRHADRDLEQRQAQQAGQRQSRPTPHPRTAAGRGLTRAEVDHTEAPREVHSGRAPAPCDM